MKPFHTPRRTVWTARQSRPERAAGGLALAAGAGAALMYYLDPTNGRRRRALVRDKLVKLASRIDDAVDMTVRDVENRLRGLAARIQARFAREEVDDSALEARVRSILGRTSSHPKSIEVRCVDGRVTLSGPILAEEVESVLRAAGRVRGVKYVEDHLDPHEEPGNIPQLQGGRSVCGPRFELLQERWSPAARLAVGSAGTGLLAYGLTRKAPAACALGCAGLALIARAAANRPLKRLIDVTPGRRGLDSGTTPRAEEGVLEQERR